MISALKLLFQNMNRPTSVSVISWILIVTSAISLLFSLYNLKNPLALELMAKSPLPISFQFVLMFVGVGVSFLCGLAMRSGADWSRKIYVGWSAIGMIIGLFTSPVKVALIPGLLLLLIFAFFLYRPKANAFFKPQAVVGDA
jgi:hypothetical protein